MSAKKSTRNRRTDDELFIDTLNQVGGSSQPVGNITLRKLLGWNEDKYARVRLRLISNGQVIPGTGKGGSVKIAHLETKGIVIFISYSHVDENYKSDPENHLGPLKQLGLIETWHDSKIKPGDVWDKSISENL